MAPRCFFIELLFTAMASHTAWSARTHHPPFAPVSPRLLLCGSLSHSLPLSLSYPLSLSLSLCLSLLLSVPLPLRPTLSLSPLRPPPIASHSLSLSCIKAPPGFEPSSTGRLSLLLSVPLPLRPTLSLSPLRPPPIASHSLSLSCIKAPPGFEPSSTGQKRCDISTGPRRVVIRITALIRLASPVCHPLSRISPFAWGPAQQRVEEPHSVPGYRVRLSEERSLEQPQEVSSARQPWRGGGGIGGGVQRGAMGGKVVT